MFWRTCIILDRAANWSGAHATHWFKKGFFPQKITHILKWFWLVWFWLKVRWFRNDFWYPRILPKNERTNLLFLEESQNTKSPFEIIWPLISSKQVGRFFSDFCYGLYLDRKCLFSFVGNKEFSNFILFGIIINCQRNRCDNCCPPIVRSCNYK